MGCLLKGGGGLYSRLIVGAVLLAAGSGSRMGNRPKCLLELGGVHLIRRQLIALSGAGIDEVVVVLGHHQEQIEPFVQDFPVTLAVNPQPDEGQSGSLRTGLHGLNGKLDAIVVALADQPLLNQQDYVDLISAFKKRPDGTRLVVPSVNTFPGNPIIFEESLSPEILAKDSQFGCKQWLANHPEQVHFWSTSNRRYSQDIDTPEDIEALANSSGHRLAWPAWLRETA